MNTFYRVASVVVQAVCLAYVAVLVSVIGLAVLLNLAAKLGI